jgi:hypothetical protein
MLRRQAVRGGNRSGARVNLWLATVRQICAQSALLSTLGVVIAVP